MRRFSPRTRTLGSMLGGRVAQWMQRGFIKSIQTGTVALPENAASATATITAVDTANAILLAGDVKSSSAAGWSGLARSQAMGALVFTNATTITAQKSGAYGAGVLTLQFAFTVIEFYPGVLKSVQRGTITIAGAATSNTATITAVNTAKAVCMGLGGNDGGVGADTVDTLLASLVLTNGTTVTASRVTAAAFTVYESYQVVEFF